MKCINKLLKKLVNIAVIIVLMYFSAKTIGKNKDKRICRLQQSKCMLECMLDMIENGIMFTDVLPIRKESRIAVYGNGNIGKHVIRELFKEEVNVCCIIDRISCTSTFENIPIFSPEDDLPSMDIVLVTVVDEYEDVKQKLLSKLECPIINLAEVWRKC